MPRCQTEGQRVCASPTGPVCRAYLSPSKPWQRGTRPGARRYRATECGQQLLRICRRKPLWRRSGDGSQLQQLIVNGRQAPDADNEPTARAFLGRGLAAAAAAGARKERRTHHGEDGSSHFCGHVGNSAGISNNRRRRAAALQGNGVGLGARQDNGVHVDCHVLHCAPVPILAADADAHGGGGGCVWATTPLLRPRSSRHHQFWNLCRARRQRVHPKHTAAGIFQRRGQLEREHWCVEARERVRTAQHGAFHARGTERRAVAGQERASSSPAAVAAAAAVAVAATAAVATGCGEPHRPQASCMRLGAAGRVRACCAPSGGPCRVAEPWGRG
mmetsp:Transcript_84466/g.235610  ORF Transcript_84466/g.235610 Transcript_84466/m.235610 type:complete len:331 (-) Transcript_84466:772-1764(-)